ncbi:MAG: orotate phosphoribosyltransferase [Candidatus Diapherotrites archaeon]
MISNDEKKDLALELHRIGVVKFGEFTLKSGLKAPIYLDLRLLVSYPSVLEMAAKALISLISGLEFDRIAGIPYAAIPIATAVSLQSEVPMIYPRKEAKDYGLKRPIEGEFKEGETILVFDDLITTGGSKIEAIAPLEASGLKVKDIAVIVDREQGGKEELKAKGYELHSVLTLKELLNFLKDGGKISEEEFSSLMNYLENPAEWKK